jgi:hypothetical protein
MADVQEGNASHKRTGYAHGVSILMMNHGVVAKAVHKMLQIFLKSCSKFPRKLLKKLLKKSKS